MGSSDGDDHINVDDYDGDDGEEVDELGCVEGRDNFHRGL